MKETDLLESFLPLKLLGRIHGASGDRPAAVEFAAAVLFVDVSRYTALVEQLARRGQGGLEKISRLLSLSYGRCADQICDRGGEVLYFEGDFWLPIGRRTATISERQFAPQPPAPRRSAVTIMETLRP